jgi:hypothetical protein
LDTALGGRRNAAESAHANRRVEQESRIPIALLKLPGILAAIE